MSFRHRDDHAATDGPYCWGDRVQYVVDGIAEVGQIEIAPTHPGEDGRHSWGPIVGRVRLFWVRPVGRSEDYAVWVAERQIVGLI